MWNKKMDGRKYLLWQMGCSHNVWMELNWNKWVNLRVIKSCLFLIIILNIFFQLVLFISVTHQSCSSFSWFCFYWFYRNSPLIRLSTSSNSLSRFWGTSKQFCKYFSESLVQVLTILFLAMTVRVIQISYSILARMCSFNRFIYSWLFKSNV